MRALIVVPALNEQAALPPLLEELRAFVAAAGLPKWVVAVIDDGSTDRTARIAAGADARLVRLSCNLGIGAAVQSGLRMALREGFDFAVQLDGDGQHPPGELPKLLGALARSPAPDLVLGSRYLANGGHRSTAVRRLAAKWLMWTLRAVIGLRVSDPTSGFRLYGRRALELFDQTYPYDFPEPESLAIAKAAGLRIVEVAVTMRERQGGRSSLSGLRGAYYMLKVTLAVLLAYLRSSGRAAALEVADG
jgi:glycosyltransferase involved in cell wall biosynthesis